ncbi:MAG: hypothetical protein AAF223_23510, partial [Bacteroidota bacterium]
AAQEEVAVDSFYVSDTVTIAGLPYPTPTTIKGGSLVKNGVELESDSTSVKSGDQLAIKLQSSNQYQTAVSSELIINDVTTTFTITTNDYQPEVFSFALIKNAKLDSTYLTETVTLSGIPHPTPTNVDNAILLVNSQEVTQADTIVRSGDQIAVKIKASSEWSGDEQAVLSVGQTTALVSITTESTPWKRLANYPIRGISSSFTAGNKIYMGGSGIDNDFTAYDIQSNTWHIIKSPPNVITGVPPFFSTEGRAFFICPDEDLNIEKIYLYEYHPTEDLWKKVTTYPGDKYSESASTLSVFTVGNKIYTMILNECYEYDLNLDTWTKKSDFPVSTDSYLLEDYGYFKFS